MISGAGEVCAAVFEGAWGGRHLTFAADLVDETKRMDTAVIALALSIKEGKGPVTNLPIGDVGRAALATCKNGSRGSLGARCGEGQGEDEENGVGFHHVFRVAVWIVVEMERVSVAGRMERL